MRLNKVMKSLAVALPLFALGACSSSSDEAKTQSQVDTNASEIAEENANAQAIAAQREAQIKEREAQAKAEMDRLRAEQVIYFDFDVSTLSREYTAMLDAHAKFLNANSGIKVVVEGHADERGTPEYNIALGERRAKAVVTYLENMGVSPSQLTVVSYGEEKPMVRDRSESAFAKNRRAVLVY